jgi:integrase/recombinase XerC
MLEKFITYLQVEKRYSVHTITAYEKDLDQFLEFSTIQSDSDLKEVNHQLIRAWIVYLMENKCDARSVNRKLSTLRTFFAWANREQIIKQNPMVKVIAPKTKKRNPSFVKQTEIQPEKTNHLFSDDFEGLRDKLMFELFYQTGIRLSELIELKEKNISSTSIKVLGKRNKERLIPISADLYALIQNYKTFKNQADLKNDNLFVLNNDNKLYPKFVYRKINYYLSTVTNLEKRSPHVLRHTFATHMLNNGAGLEVLKEILGHANLSATQVYTHNSFAQLTHIYSQAHPRGHKND